MVARRAGISNQDQTVRLLRPLLALAVAISVGVLLWGINLPLTDQHGFRQTQTAISVYWMLHGGPWWDYETPVLGTSWSIPFEFPLYQWIVALLVRATGMPLDPAGRLISYLWLVAGLWPVAFLTRSFRLGSATSKLYAILLLASPIYLFWGRAFLIETQAVSLGFATLALLRAFLVRRTWWVAALAMLANAGAALTKITTEVPFILLMVAMTMEALWIERGQRGRQLATLAGSAVAMLPGPLLFALWTRHADALKAANPTATLYRASAPQMTAWTMGPWSERLSAEMAVTMLRATIDVGGWSGLAFVLLAAYLILRLRPPGAALTIALLLLGAWALSFAIFANLHIVHTYYQAGNAALLIAALAAALGGVVGRVRPTLLAGLVALVLVSQLARFGMSFAPTMRLGLFDHERRLGLAVRAATPPGSAIVGTGLDWSPVLPYYAERKALLIVANQPVVAMRRQLADPVARLGGLPLGAVVLCPSPIDHDRAARAALARLVRGMAERDVEGCRLFIPAT